MWVSLHQLFSYPNTDTTASGATFVESEFQILMGGCVLKQQMQTTPPQLQFGCMSRNANKNCSWASLIELSIHHKSLIGLIAHSG